MKKIEYQVPESEVIELKLQSLVMASNGEEPGQADPDEPAPSREEW